MVSGAADSKNASREDVVKTQREPLFRIESNLCIFSKLTMIFGCTCYIASNGREVMKK